MTLRQNFMKSLAGWGWFLRGPRNKFLHPRDEVDTKTPYICWGLYRRSSCSCNFISFSQKVSLVSYTFSFLWGRSWGLKSPNNVSMIKLFMNCVVVMSWVFWFQCLDDIKSMVLDLLKFHVFVELLQTHSINKHINSWQMEIGKCAFILNGRVALYVQKVSVIGINSYISLLWHESNIYHCNLLHSGKISTIF